MRLCRHWGNQTADARQAAEVAKAEAAERAAEAEAVAKTSDRASAEAEAKTLQVGLYSLLLAAPEYARHQLTAICSCKLHEADHTPSILSYTGEAATCQNAQLGRRPCVLVHVVADPAQPQQWPAQQLAELARLVHGQNSRLSHSSS